MDRFTAKVVIRGKRKGTLPGNFKEQRANIKIRFDLVPNYRYQHPPVDIRE